MKGYDCMLKEKIKTDIEINNILRDTNNMLKEITTTLTDKLK
jgi:hypothetical protein